MAIVENTQFGRVGAFRFWCQKVLPAVYDDSLSYYELLAKVVDYLNQVIEITNTQSDAITELQETLAAFMAGTFDPYIEEKVDEWFDNNQPSIMSTLTILSNSVGRFNVCEYGADNTGATDCSQAILDCAAAADGLGGIWFPNGEYRIDSSVDLTPYDVFNINGEGATLVAGDNLTYMLKPFVATTGTHKDHFHLIDGINFDGKNIASTAIVTAQQMTIGNCNFSDFIGVCISPENTASPRTSAQGIYIHDCIFYGDALANTTAIMIGYDCIVDNVKIVGFQTGIDTLDGTSTFSSLDIWSRQSTYYTYGVKSPTASNEGKFVNCMFDTLNEAIRNYAGDFVNCIFLYNGSDANTQNYTVLTTNDNTGATIANFASCTFNMWNSFDLSVFAVSNSNETKVVTSGCKFEGSFPSENLFGNLHECLITDDLVKRITNLPTLNKWYHIATATKQKNVADASQWFLEFALKFANSGRTTLIQLVSTRSNFEYQEVYYNYSLATYFEIGAVIGNRQIDIYAKPVQASGQDLIVDRVNGGESLNAFWLERYETNYTDSDMDVITTFGA